MVDAVDLEKLGAMISNSLEEINTQIKEIKNTDDVKFVKRRIKLFIKEMKENKRKVNEYKKRLRELYAQRKPSKGVFGLLKMTRKDINTELSAQLSPWNDVTSVSFQRQ